MRIAKSLLGAGIMGMTIAYAFAVYAYTSASDASGMSAQDFVRKVSVSNEFEIESSQLALDKSGNDDVKKFADRMIRDHTKAAAQLQDALKSSSSGAQPAEGLDKKHQKLLDTLKSASADDFDSQYIDMQTTAHKKAVSLFTAYSKNGGDAALKNFAAQTLPTLKSHLKHITELKANE